MSQVRNCMPSLSQNISLDRDKHLMNNVMLRNPRIRFTGSRSCVFYWFLCVFYPKVYV